MRLLKLPAAGAVILACTMISCGQFGQYTASGGFAKKKFTRGLVKTQSSPELQEDQDQEMETETLAVKDTDLKTKKSDRQNPKSVATAAKSTEESRAISVRSTRTFHHEENQETPEYSLLDDGIHQQDEIYTTEVEVEPYDEMEELESTDVDITRHDRVAKAGFWLSIASLGMAVGAIFLTMNPATAAFVGIAFVSALAVAGLAFIISAIGKKSTKYGYLAGVGMVLSGMLLGLVALFYLGTAALSLLM